MSIKKLLQAFISSIALVMNYYMIHYSNLDKFLSWKNIIIICLLLIFIYYLYHKIKFDNKYFKILSIIFTIFIIIGNQYRIFESIIPSFKINNLLFNIISGIGFYFLIYYILDSISKIIIYFRKKPDLKENKVIRLFNKKPFLFCFITIFFCWSIYYIAFYPIVLSPDPSYQIKQAMGERTKYSDYNVQINKNVNITNHHPVFHTMLLGTSLKLGRAILNDNFGLFIYTSIQGIFMAITLSMTICFLKKRNIKNRYLMLMLIIYSLVPMFPLYAINGNKDVYYTMFIIHLLMFIFEFITDYKNKKITIKKCLYLFFILLFTCLFRNNGFIIIIILFPFMLFFSKVNFKKILITFLLAISIFTGYEKILLPSLGITGTSIRESMSLFFQQTARYVNNHESEVTASEKEIIGKILDYDTVISKYKPELADPVKNTYNKYATKDDLLKYLGVWFKEFINHPLTYIDATLNNTYGYFDIGKTNWYVYVTFDKRITKNHLVKYHFNSLVGLRGALASYGVSYPYIPIIGLLSNISFNVWIIIAYSIYLIFTKKNRYHILLIPLYVSILICFVSPANTYFRYAMPYVFSTPFIIGTYFIISKKELKK